MAKATPRRLAWFCVLLGTAFGACLQATDTADGNYRTAFTLAPSVVEADGQQAATLSAQLADAAGLPLVGHKVQFHCESERGTDAVDVFATSDAGGKATAALTRAQAGRLSCGAWFFDGGRMARLPDRRDVAFVAATLTVAAAAGAIEAVANGEADVLLTLSAHPARGQEAIVLESVEDADVLTPARVVLDANGQGHAVVRSTRAGTRPVTARSLVRTLGAEATVGFVAGPVDLAHSKLSLGKATIAPNGSQQVSVEVVLCDAFANPVPGGAVALLSGSANATFVPPQGATDGNGRFVAVLSAPAKASLDVRAAVPGPAGTSQATHLTQQVAPYYGPPDAAASSLGASAGQNLRADGHLVGLKGVVADAAGKALAGERAVLEVAEPTAQVTPRLVQTDANGRFSATLRSRRAGTHVVTAQLGNNSLLRGRVTLTPVPVGCTSAVTLPMDPSPLYAAPRWAYGLQVAAARFDADGYDDVVAILDAADTANLYVLAGGPNGLHTTPSWVADVPGTPLRFALADFDGDGRPDVAVLNHAKQLTVVSPSLAARSYALPYAGQSLCVGDVDGDGHPDVVVVASDPNAGVSVLRNQGDGSLGAASYLAVGQALTSCAVLDLNHDGCGDVLASDPWQATVWGLAGDNNGTLTVVGGIAVPGCDLLDNLVAADFDGDGALDVAASCSFAIETPERNRVRTWRNDGNGQLVAQGDVQAGYDLSSGSLQAADVDGDGRLDLLAVSPAGQVLRFAGAGNVDFAAPIATGVAASLRSATVGDFAGRGLRDVAHAAAFPPVGVLAAHANNVLAGVQVAPALGAPARFVFEVHKVVAGDLNGDGKTDFVGAQWNEAPKLYLQQADGSFAVRAVTAPATARAIAVGTFVSAGPPTLLQGGFYQPDLCLYPNSGDGQLQGCTPVGTRNARWWELVAGDVNGDGLDDVVGAIDLPNLVVTYHSLGDGNFVPGPDVDAAAAVTPTPQTTALHLVDVDNDGARDLVVGTSANVYVYHNDGRGHFALRQTLAAAQDTAYPAPNSVAIADLDGDGWVDLVTGSWWQDPWIFRNRGDGTFAVHHDPSTAPSNPHLLPPALIDLNGDGYVDLVGGVNGHGIGGLRIRLGGPNATFGAPFDYYASVPGQVVGARLPNDAAAVFATANALQPVIGFFTVAGCSP